MEHFTPIASLVPPRSDRSCVGKSFIFNLDAAMITGIAGFELSAFGQRATPVIGELVEDT